MNVNTRRSTPLVLLAACALVVAGCGSSSSSPDNVTDRAFVNDMTPHHRSAIAMAKIARTRGRHPEVKQLAAEIITAQQSELGKLDAFKGQLGAGDEKSTLGESMAAMGMTMDDVALKTAEPFDRAFIDMMSPHHVGAISMARIELAKGSNPKVKALAQAIIGAQAKEKDAMQAWRARWYGPVKPGAPTG